MQLLTRILNTTIFFFLSLLVTETLSLQLHQKPKEGTVRMFANHQTVGVLKHAANHRLVV